MAPNFSKITSRTDVKIAIAATAAISAWFINKSVKSSKPRHGRPGVISPEERVQYMIKDKNKKGPKAQVDARFFAELTALWKIMVPGIWSRESGFMLLIAFSLASRTMCDLWLIQHTTLVEGFNAVITSLASIAILNTMLSSFFSTFYPMLSKSGPVDFHALLDFIHQSPRLTVPFSVFDIDTMISQCLSHTPFEQYYPGPSSLANFIIDVRIINIGEKQSDIVELN